ncbi:MAG TPA: biotin/lipoyl-containing protein, partial [Steroidobacteraceae bacterium]|nr:biotin/lipoyl-containing protein [Steroidobacteraceae bacterium]
RSANAVGYTNYPDNVVRYFVEQAAKNGIDLFRLFDSLNWVENMRVAMDAVLKSGKLCEAAICYTGNLLDPKHTKYDLKYYLGLARELKTAGAHIIGIKDMAGLCQPRAAYTLVKALKDEIGLPLHFHTHDTSGIAAASVLAAIDAGADAVDGALDSMSGLTSQPNLTSIVEALRHGPRDSGVDPEKLRALSDYWAQVRRNYSAFESDLRAGASEVYVHGMPGGQFTNLREQARSLGIDDSRWPEVSRAYAEVNQMFGDIIKVTPTSKVVGDMALMMVTSGLSPQTVLDPKTEVAFPESVVQLFRGDIGQPPGGFPAELQKKILKGAKPNTARPGAILPATDLTKARAETETKCGRAISDAEFASFLMYPKVFLDYVRDAAEFGSLRDLPSSIFFYGMQAGDEVAVDIERGKTLIIRFVAMSDPHEDGTRTVFFELNGQPRSVKVADRSTVALKPPRRKAEANSPNHVAAPMPGTVATINVSAGGKVKQGDVLITIEAMKMETAVRAERDGTIGEVITKPGEAIDAKDLLLIMA